MPERPRDSGRQDRRPETCVRTGRGPINSEEGAFAVARHIAILTIRTRDRGAAVNDEDLEWDAIIKGLRRGDAEVVAHFYRRYGEPLQAIADRKIGEQLRRRIDASDVVQSAMRTFFRRAHEGRVELGDSEKLWNLLCAITLTKVREQARFHRRNRRDVQRESPASAVDESGLLPIERVPHHEPTPDVVAEFRDQLQFLMDAMDDEERQVLACKLQDCTNDETASQMGISERSVRRILSRLKHRLEQQIGAAGE